MIPIGDSVRSRTTPYVNISIIAINVVVFFYELTLSATPGLFGSVSELDRFFYEWGSIPACLSDRLGLDPALDPRALAFCREGHNGLLTVASSMFMHGGWLHLIGNMIFLWVFGDNVEDAMGHVRYAVFYAVVGLGATAAHVAIGPDEFIPAIGASGAIAGVLGAYLLLYPRARVSAILPLFIFFWMPFQVPAIVLIGVWFVMQLLNGVASLATADVVGAGGGVAWFAHIGGFVAGLVLVRLFVLGRSVPPPRPAPRRWRGREW